MTNAEGSWKETVEGIKNAVQSQIYVSTNTTLSKHNADRLPNHHRLHQRTRRGRIWLQQPHLQRQSTSGKQRIRPNHRRTQSAAAQNPRQSQLLGLKFLWYTPTQYCELQPRPARIRRQKLHRRHDQRLRRTQRRRLPMPKLLRIPRQHPHRPLGKNLEQPPRRETTQTRIRRSTNAKTAPTCRFAEAAAP